MASVPCPRTGSTFLACERGTRIKSCGFAYVFKLCIEVVRFGIKLTFSVLNCLDYRRGYGIGEGGGAAGCRVEMGSGVTGVEVGEGGSKTCKCMAEGRR